jgi:hypothetical protein|tara:strand:+ start:759 stop:965 length:207 start_codon:yes stop_codon:yes gene_type:complete
MKKKVWSVTVFEVNLINAWKRYKPENSDAMDESDLLRIRGELPGNNYLISLCWLRNVLVALRKAGKLS